MGSTEDVEEGLSFFILEGGIGVVVEEEKREEGKGRRRGDEVKRGITMVILFVDDGCFVLVLLLLEVVDEFGKKRTVFVGENFGC